MKTIIYTICAFLFSMSLTAQCLTENTEKYSLDGDIVKVERFDAKGNLIEKGQYTKDGTLTGKWINYRTDGSTISVAYYEAGEKVGNWTHYDSFQNLTHQVSYENGMIADVESTETTSLAKE